MDTRDPNESALSPSASENYDRIGPKPYSYGELAKATGLFSHNNLIGRGGFGHVFKASLDGETRAIKRLDYPGIESEGDLEREIMVVKSISHKNLVELVGYCIDGANRLLILKYFPNGSLRSKLDGKENVLDWKKRMNIAIGSARGLEYLHEHCEPKIIHLDIKPDNILLDEHFEPKITDFGLAHVFTDVATHISKSSVMGTRVYEDPLTTKLGKYSDKSDIYSFGVTLLELITGRKPLDNGTDIVTWANLRIKKVLDGKYANFVDSKLHSFDAEQMHRMVSCINSCLNQPPNSRPTMEKIRLVLEGKSPLEELYGHEGLQLSMIYKESQNVLDWKKRMKIAIGSARGLEYLHEQCNPKIIHLDIKPNNIILDHNFEPKISDFGLSTFFTDDDSDIDESYIGWTPGYTDPAIFQSKKYSDKFDVYSFGITLLELITGRKPIHKGLDIVTWVNPLIKKALDGEYVNFVDSRLQSFDHNEMHRMIFCANSCINQSPKSRPSMKKIFLALEGLLPLEVLWDEKNNYLLERAANEGDPVGVRAGNIPLKNLKN
ncbi:proline-rich receptor-like protein kinase PERK15 isoform X3 [Manihot esculenta]|uniref:proline-rich receptor-like protein kinase PERK15 isoform X3 n=1 Tax=Manihot esculenta TaxID=3983 RepID=UPI000B5D67FA|nr:proline-rich receptor-like protein kinase PERK15 isoform X3 [Manihot esculenta]